MVVNDFFPLLYGLIGFYVLNMLYLIQSLFLFCMAFEMLFT